MNIPVQPPEVTQDALYLRTDTTPEEIFQAIGRLRKEARDEIDRLIGFLDKTDDYVSRELEDDNDQQDASYPEGMQRMCEHPMEDDEDAGDDEPSLGSSGHGEAGPIIYLAHAISAEGEMAYDCEADEHDGREPDVDDEPSLCGIQVQCDGSDSAREFDLGSPDSIIDQRLTMLESGIAWSVADGEDDGHALI